MSREDTSEPSLDAGMPNEETSEPTTLILDLFPIGDDASGYRTRNDPSQPWQRLKVTERSSSAFYVKCDMVDVIHGRLGFLDDDDDDGTDYPATLLVLAFRFDSLKHARRIESAEVTFHFVDKTGDPAVINIAPNGNLHLVETSQAADTRFNGNINVGAPPLAGFQAGVQLGWEESKTRVKHDSTRLVGRTFQFDRDYGDDNAASWYLFENATEQTGVPTTMRATILLKRKHDLPFQCNFTMRLKVDLKSTLEGSFQKARQTIFGQGLIDEPLLFDPTRKPSTSQSKRFKINNLASEDLRSLSSVVAKTVLHDAVRHVGQD